MRLIDADELLKKATDLEAVALEQVAKYGPLSDIHPGEWHRWDSILQERTAFKYDLMDAPIIDAVPVVRCRDCRHCMHNEFFDTYYCWKNSWSIHVEKDSFCSWGERRENAEKTD